MIYEKETESLLLNHTTKYARVTTFAYLFIIVFATMSMTWTVSSFLPIFIQANFPTLSATQIGVLNSIYPIGFCSTAPLISNFSPRHGHKRTILSGVTLQVIATITFGISSHLQKVAAFYSISLFSRFLQGFAEALICINIPPLIVKLY
jgi:MFS family permease